LERDCVVGSTVVAATETAELLEVEEALETAGETLETAEEDLESAEDDLGTAEEVLATPVPASFDVFFAIVTADFGVVIGAELPTEAELEDFAQGTIFFFPGR